MQTTPVVDRYRPPPRRLFGIRPTGKGQRLAHLSGTHQTDHGTRRYRCQARELGHDCEQKSIRASEAEAPVAAALMQLKLPDNWRERIVQAIAEMVGDQKLNDRLDEIRETIERMDFRWDHGFITNKDSYLEQRTALQQEFDQLTPIPDDDLVFAEGLLTNFAEYWETAKEDPDEQERLFQLILVRAWVIDNQVVEICLRPNYHVVLGLDQKRPTEISVDLGKSYQSGSDGLQPPAGHVYLVAA